MKLFCFDRMLLTAALFISCSLPARETLAPESRPVTAGWENICADRQDYPPTKILWRADLTSTEGYQLRKLGGAEGSFTIRNGLLEISKDNDTGLLVLEAPPARLMRGARLRIAADVHVETCDLEHSHASLRVRDERGGYRHFHELTPANCGDSIITSGPELARGLNESAPGMFSRKYGQWIVRDTETVFAIVVSGRPSVTRWRDFLAEDYDAAQEKWKSIWTERTAKDHAAEMMNETEFDRLLANDTTNHVAEMRTVDGITALYIDGRKSPAIAYKGKHSFATDALKETFCGGRLAKAGVPIMVRTLNLGTGVDPRRYWSKNGFDAKGAVRDIKNAMRLAPNALFMIGLSCNAYPEFTNIEHPDQIWITPKGEKLMGRAGTTDDSDDMGIKDNRRWPWVSMASPVWRAAIRTCIRELIAELKAQNLDKRVIGLHMSGFADGQFYPPTADHSSVARARYPQWCAEGRHVSTNYWFYCKNLGMDAQNEFAREFKRALGKPAVAVRWCLCEFIGSQDITEFNNSDALDVIVAQPAYTRRWPGIAHGSNLPFSSFSRNGKMFWMEFDFRTYAALDTWAVSAVAAKGCGEVIDFPMWQCMFRQYAGQQLATRSGWWFYDMGGGWWDRSELADDIGDVVKIGRKLSETKPSAWRPSVAVVYDEKGLVGWDGGTRPQNNFSHLLFPYQQRRFAASGVPYEFFLADEVMRHPSLLENSRLVVLANFRKLDEERVAFIRSLSTGGRTLLFLAETGVLGGAEDGTTFRTEYDFADRPHDIVSQTDRYDMLALNETLELRDLENGQWPVSSAPGPRGTVMPDSGTEILSRFKEDGKTACVIREDKDCRRIYCCEPSGVSPQAFLAFAREAKSYVPVSETGLQVDMNGDFVSVHALRNGQWTFTLPHPCKVVNLKSGKEEPVQSGTVDLRLTAGETCWFRLL